MRDKARSAQSNVYTLAANTKQTFPTQGRFARCLSSTGELEISLNAADRIYFNAGISVSLENDTDEFENITLYNDTNEAVTATIVTGFGNVEDDRLSVSGQIDVNAGFDFLENGGLNLARTFDPNVLDLRRLMMGLEEGGYYKTKGFVDHNGASYYAAQGVVSLSDIVSAASNTGGIMILSAQIESGEGDAYISIDNTRFINPVGRYNASVGMYSSNCQIENHTIPAGKALKYASTNATSRCCLVYKLLG